MMNQKGVAGILILIFFLIFATAGGYLVYLVYTGEAPSEAVSELVSRFIDIEDIKDNYKDENGVKDPNGKNGGTNGIDPSKDYCTYKNVKIQEGETYSFDVNCNACLCSDGGVYCSDRVCSQTSLAYYSLWNDYIDDRGVSFKYPQDWHVTTREYTKSLTKSDLAQKTWYYAVSRGDGYTVEFYVPEEPKIIDSIECRYKDSPWNPKLAIFEEYSSYDAVNDGITYLRRSYDNDTGKYYICKSSNNIYIRTVRLNKVEYLVPEKAYIDATIISDMDYIVFSFNNAKLK